MGIVETEGGVALQGRAPAAADRLDLLANPVDPGSERPREELCAEIAEDVWRAL